MCHVFCAFVDLTRALPFPEFLYLPCPIPPSRQTAKGCLSHLPQSWLPQASRGSCCLRGPPHTHYLLSWCCYLPDRELLCLLLGPPPQELCQTPKGHPYGWRGRPWGESSSSYPVPSCGLGFCVCKRRLVLPLADKWVAGCCERQAAASHLDQDLGGHPCPFSSHLTGESETQEEDGPQETAGVRALQRPPRMAGPAGGSSLKPVLTQLSPLELNLWNQHFCEATEGKKNPEFSGKWFRGTGHQETLLTL